MVSGLIGGHYDANPVAVNFKRNGCPLASSAPAGSTDGTVYTTYLFGAGAFAKGAAPLDASPVEGGTGTALILNRQVQTAKNAKKREKGRNWRPRSPSA